MSGGLNIPDVVTKALPEAARATAYLRLRAGLDSLLGETHLLAIDGGLGVVVQPSMLSAATPLAGPVRAELEIGSLRSMLRLHHAGGAGTVTLGYGESEPVRAFLDALATSAARAEAPAIEVAEAEDEAPISDEAPPAPAPAAAAPEPPAPEPPAPEPATPGVQFTLPPFVAPSLPPSFAPPLAPALLGTLASRDVFARAELLSVLQQRAALLADAERAEERGRAQQLAALARARRARDEEERRTRGSAAKQEREAQAHRDEPAKQPRKARRKKKGAGGGDIPVRPDGSLVRSERAVHLQAELGQARGLPIAPADPSHQAGMWRMPQPAAPPPRAPRSLRAPQEERRWVSVLVWIAFAVLSTMLGAAAYRTLVPAPPPDAPGSDDVRRLGPPTE